MQRGSLDEIDAVTVTLVLDAGYSPFILTLYVSVPASVFDSEVGIPPSPFKLFGLTQADWSLLGTSESLQGIQSSLDMERLSATTLRLGHFLHALEDFSSAYWPASHPRLFL